jgi:hypothetical protein
LEGILVTALLKTEAASKSLFCANLEKEYNAASRWLFVDAQQRRSVSSHDKKSESIF